MRAQGGPIMHVFTSILSGLVFASLSISAMACSDTLYRVGKDVSYRVYTAPLPGSVLVYGQSESARHLAQALQQSGHGVRFVDNSIQLTTELATGQYDVVIAPYTDHETVEASTSASGNADTVYLPVVVTREQEKVASENYSRVMLAERDDIKHYLKAIHKTLKEKS